MKLVSIAILILLSSCPVDPVDQAAHFGQSYVMACDLSRWAEPELAVQTVMDYATAREDLQHQGQCGEGCQLDLAFWREGAEAGAKCPSSKTPR